ncbi:xylitol dehydrogenase [Coprinopsis cinerea okayama7|uniref:Xylitol dehydrogenase n=1 Tax=Coprinopsis cinerea (strain Okayama-7 / 130 / ATCC MYA-4618 / FGSC 9003) TaxID=240176 RepID=A8NXT6_COPC7|nr:xylitol dehydrogenase [Coprinopsis cinerea okayama7\|eukprot:XP_001837263.1 xylitol dehydrogenase [Coprinopsis cinerea okayama7\
MSDNPSFVLKGINDVVFEQRPIPEVTGDEVLVAVKKTGICGSDVHYLLEGRIGDFVVKSPMVLGHESSGVVAKVGPKVKHLKVGDRVAMEPGATCRACEACKLGKYELCPDIIFAATPPYDGTLARYYKLPADLAYPLPDNVTLEDGAMMEPLSVGVHSVANLGNFRAGQSIAVFGCGPVGLLCMAVAKALGASRVIAIDIVPARLDFAKQYAATDSFLPPKPLEGESKVDYSRRNAAALKEALGIAERGASAIDLVIDASGAEVSIQTALHVVKSGGTFVQVGMGNPNVTIDIGVLITKELNYKGSFRYGPGDYPLAINLVAAGKVDLKPLVTHRYKFEDAITAFNATKNGKSEDGKGVIKVVISGPDVDINSN